MMDESKHVLYKALYKMIRTTRSRPKTSVEKIRSLASLLRKLRKFDELLNKEIVKIAEELADNKVEEYFIAQNEKVILKKVDGHLCVNVSPLTKTDRITAKRQYKKRGYSIE